MSEKAVQLSELPKDKEFEEYVSAFFQADGFFVEKNIVNKGEEEILELDSIITNYDTKIPRLRLIEAKSGKWRFSEIFKIKGWKDYINIKRSYFITQQSKQSLDFYKRIARELGVHLIVIEDLQNPQNYLNRLIRVNKVDDNDITLWRYSFWAERATVKYLQSRKGSEQEKACFKQINGYYLTVHSGVFFTTNVLDRLKILFDNFRSTGNLSARTANELNGGDFEEDPRILDKELYWDTFYKCNLNGIQITTYTEHLSKLAILKNMIDYIIYCQAGSNKHVDETLAMIGDIKISKKDFLPPSFLENIEKISNDAYFYRYAIFWQWFLWFFGGFILKDYEDWEYELLSQKTGIPYKEIDNALNVLNVLFPLQEGGSWFLESKYSNIRILKFFPVQFMGIGANTRRLYYTQDGDFDSLKVTGKHTLNDLKKWNNLTVDLLDRFPS